MDFNYLYARQQVSLMRADDAACIEARRAHLGLATLYAERIDKERARRAPAGI
jgi:hypothetical protein